MKVVCYVKTIANVLTIKSMIEDYRPFLIFYRQKGFIAGQVGPNVAGFDYGYHGKNKNHFFCR